MRKWLASLWVVLVIAVAGYQPVSAQDTPGSKLDAELAAIKARQVAQDAEIAALKARAVDAEARLNRLEGGQPGPPPLPVPPQPPRERKLIGGFRLAGLNFGRAAFGVNWETRTLRAGGLRATEINEYVLPAEIPAGTDPNQWPILQPTRRIPAWWNAESNLSGVLYISGIAHFRNKWWVCLKSDYDGTSPAVLLTLYAEDGEVIKFDGTTRPKLGRQAFSGFVKRGPGLDPYIGCGGYESGQASSAGPTLATLAGEVLINPGPFNGTWEQRAARPGNYSGIAGQNWVALTPRTINGVLEGRWAADRVYGGGLALPEGITYWPTLGTGVLDYNQQFRIPTDTFATPENEKTYQFRYDPATYKLVAFAEVVGVKKIGGQELDPKGRVWLSEREAWNFPYARDPIIRVFE